MITKRKIETLDIVIEVPEDWEDTTSTLMTESKPLTFTKNEFGVGALQMSIAKYISGKQPKIHAKTLLKMLLEFAEMKKFDKASTPQILNGEINKASASYKFRNYFIKIWYLSNGKDLAKITYTCEWGEETEELSECEEIVNSLKFK
jgi:hypothetical protein